MHTKEFDDKNLLSEPYFVRDSFYPQPNKKPGTITQRSFRLCIFDGSKKKTKSPNNTLFSYSLNRTIKAKLDPSKVITF